MNQTIKINGGKVSELIKYWDGVQKKPIDADRYPTVFAEWVGGSRSKINFGENVTYLGGVKELNPMQMLLAALAACNVELIILNASILGIDVESLSIEANGHYDLRSYFGLDKSGSGYDVISYTVWLKAPGITNAQIDYLLERCEKSYPFGDSLARKIPMNFEIIVE